MQAGERAHVMGAVSLEDLRSGVGKAILGDLGTMSAAEARIRRWADGGPTELSNLVLMCAHHRVSRMRLRGSDVEARVA